MVKDRPLASVMFPEPDTPVVTNEILPVVVLVVVKLPIRLIAPALTDIGPATERGLLMVIPEVLPTLPNVNPDKPLPTVKLDKVCALVKEGPEDTRAKVPVVLTAKPFPNQKSLLVRLILLLEVLTLDVTALIVTAE